MMRTELNVPFKEKDIVKKMGAKWDPEKKVWYVLSEDNLEDFKKWIIEIRKPEFNFRADSFFIAEASGSCWSCSKYPRFISLGLYSGCFMNCPSGSEMEEWNDEELAEDETCKYGIISGWFERDSPALLYYVREISDGVRRHMQSLSSGYQMGYSSTAKMSYWMNHCEYCGAKQGDFMEYCEPDGLFSGNSGDAHITRHNISEGLVASCDGYNPCSGFENN